jgi:type II secretory pathway component PulF
MAIVLGNKSNSKATLFWMLCVVLAMAMMAGGTVFLFPALQDTLLFEPTVSPSKTSAVNIQMSFLDSNRLLQLEPFDQDQLLFIYTARDGRGRQVNGQISAMNKVEAEQALLVKGFSNVVVQDFPVGKSNPFSK